MIINTEQLDKPQEKQDNFVSQQVNLFLRYLGKDSREGSRLADLEKAEVASLQDKLDAISREHGVAQANMYFTLYGYNSCAQGLSLARDLKMGQYCKLPPIANVIVQIIGTIIGAPASWNPHGAAIEDLSFGLTAAGHAKSPRKIEKSAAS
ncbi:hypothetical protein C6P46_005758 [Rhodotorula mucilaginosa]|uniref:Fatty acid synthase type I helical domain-containing protein n=1 Tax=Rhodotorula mucilaginosa TaxID=5537 RepID=A0A9P6W053_RHOMI|nr:hypothetical protein C6P46_005758 [Rhodotorula mucilaginosa]